MGGTGVFVKEVQQAVLDGRADIAVHSAKDLPASASPDGLVIAAVPERANPLDALVGSTLDALPAGARIGTGSVRRRAQLAALRPDLTFAELRGNIPTRLEKASEFDAIVVAAAALERLDLLDRADEILTPEVMLPQVGQGSLAVECRADDNADARAAGRDRPRGAPAGARRGARVPRPPGRRVQPALRRARQLRRRRHHVRGDDRVPRRPDRAALARDEARDTERVSREVVEELLDQGGRELLDLDADPEATR